MALSCTICTIMRRDRETTMRVRVDSVRLGEDGVGPGPFLQRALLSSSSRLTAYSPNFALHINGHLESFNVKAFTLFTFNVNTSNMRQIQETDLPSFAYNNMFGQTTAADGFEINP